MSSPFVGQFSFKWIVYEEFVVSLVFSFYLFSSLISVHTCLFFAYDLICGMLYLQCSNCLIYIIISCPVVHGCYRNKKWRYY